jgi:hypothetical protein
MLPLLSVILVLSGWLNASHFSPWVSWHSEIPFFALAVGVAWVFLWQERKNSGRRIELPKASILFALLLLTLLLQWMAGLVEWQGQVVAVALYLFVAFVGVGWGALEGSEAPHDSRSRQLLPGEWLAWALLVGGVVSVGMACIQVLSLWDGSPWISRAPHVRRPGANLGQPNHLATLLVMAMAAAWYLHRGKRFGGAVLGLLLLCIGAGLAVSESRAGLLSALCLCGWLAWRCDDLPKAQRVVSAFVLAAVLIVLFAQWPALYRDWQMDVSTTSGGMERIASSTGDARMTLWAQLVQATLLRPWSGWGFLGTAQAHNAVAHESSYSLPFSYSHSLPLDLVLWLGWPLALLVLALIAGWFFRHRGAGASKTGWFGMALVIPFAVHSALEYPFAYAYLLLPAMFGVGLVEGVRGRSRWTIRYPVAGSVLGLVTALGMWSVIDYLRVEEDYRSARFTMLKIGDPPSDPPPKILLLDQLGDLVRSTRIDLRPGMTGEEMHLMQAAALHYPWSGTQYRFAHALALNGQATEAVRQLRVLKAQNGEKAHEVLRGQIEASLVTHQLPALPPSSDPALVRD